MPTRPSPLWWLTGFLVTGFPVLNFIYWPQVLKSGVLPPDGDSIGIPMFGSILTALIASPMVFGVTWLCLRRYNPAGQLWSWRKDRPVRSVVATVLFGAASLAFTAGILESLWRPSPWYEYLWPIYIAGWLPWFVGLRAALIEQLDYEPTYSER
ncbi:hypothetical protein GCM10022281_04970 [Sphingomonas rosea]|uniref:Uncharacterized protein n=1 Tax=Sphingomonas rosea TaxID=335605 RepID=A0ABP7TNZ4_9SPHN